MQGLNKLECAQKKADTMIFFPVGQFIVSKEQRKEQRSLSTEQKIQIISFVFVYLRDYYGKRGHLVCF